MAELPITESAETTIEEPPGSLEAVAAAGSPDELAGVARRWPECLTAWASLGEEVLEADPVAAYAFFRVGYHRGLDRIRRAGWRGSGRVPWSHPANRGFLRSVAGLGHAAEAIGEGSEAIRCRDFIAQLAPDMPNP